MRILVYGGRNYGKLYGYGDFVGYSAEAACAILAQLTAITTSNRKVGDEVVIVSGNAAGADTLGEMVGNSLSYFVEVYEANWDKYGRRAGPIRNKEMRDSGIDYAIKCPGGRGTAHMTKLLEEAGVPIYEV